MSNLNIIDFYFKFYFLIKIYLILIYLDKVLVGDKECTSPQVNSNQITCTLAANSAASLPVVLKTDAGDSNNDVKFVYSLEISSLSNTEGKLNFSYY